MSFATFQAEQQAIDFEQSIHNYLKANRSRYTADKWGEIIKHQSQDLWAVPLCQEQKEVLAGSKEIVYDRNKIFTLDEQNVEIFHMDKDAVIRTLDGWMPEPQNIIEGEI